MINFKASVFKEAEKHTKEFGKDGNIVRRFDDEPYWESLGRDNRLKVKRLQSEFEIYDREEIAYEFVKSGFSVDITRDTLTRRMVKDVMKEVHHGM